MMKNTDLRDRFRDESGINWQNQDGEPDFDYVLWLENLLFSKSKLTSLEWEPNPSRERMTCDEANNYAKSLGDGWRLPSIDELKEAYERKIPGFIANHYWSSSTFVSNNAAWSVNFSNGDTYYSYKSNSWSVRCVRG